MKMRFSSREAAEFRRIFKAELKNYWNILGFDTVQQTWGVEALRFIRELIA